MVDLRLLAANLRRWPLLTGITLVTVTVAFFLFGLLLALDRVFSVGVKVEKADRLVVANAVSLMQTLPRAYQARIAEQPGVTVVAPNLFFGAYYQDVRTPLMAIATDPASFVALVPEARFGSTADKARWLDDPGSIAVGRALASEHGWQVGDLVQLGSYLYPRRDGSRSWTFRVAAIFDGEDRSANTNSLLLHYAHVNAQRAFGQDSVGWYNIRISDPARWQEVARAIDAGFANAPYGTKTGSEAAFAHELINQVGDFSLIVRLASLAVFFTLILVAANAMAHAVNERVHEFAVLKILGGSDAGALLSVLAESWVVMLAGAIFGALLTWLIVPEIAAYSVTLSALVVKPQDWLWSLLAVAIVGFIVAIVPAVQAWRVSPARDLRHAG